MSMRMVDVVCHYCGHEHEFLMRDINNPVYPLCCGHLMVRVFKGPTVRPDDIPGGLVIEHGLCNEDGSPRTYYSQSDITRECQKRGLTRWSDIHTEDKTKDARVRAEWQQSGEAQRAKRHRDEARAEKKLARASR
jgi:hypothetical protein